MEWRLAGADIGRIEPARNDNRLHLIVIDKAVEFIGEMEVLQMTAPGQGSYRIEKFVLLHDRPQPSSFSPMIENLTWRADSHKNIWRLSFHFVTSLVCDIEVAVEQIDEDQERQYQDLKVRQPGSAASHQFWGFAGRRQLHCEVYGAGHVRRFGDSKDRIHYFDT